MPQLLDCDCEVQSALSASSSCCSLGGLDSSPETSPSRIKKYRTPPSPIISDDDVNPKSTSSSLLYFSDQEDYLQFLEPSPVHAPPYSLLTPGGCPRFPIEVPATSPDEPLPKYLPTIYKIGMLTRKIEWLSPFEPSPSRLWKLIIVELNSTQLNFYYVPSNLEGHLANIQAASFLNEASFNEAEEAGVQLVSSQFTTNADLHFYKGCQRLGIFDSYRTLVPSSECACCDDDQASTSYKSSKKGARLIRSYSLQHARMGLASDYLKKPNVLRIRIESEQILLQFGSTKELVDWHFALSMGRDVSLDLEDRLIPRYRTVPRRRNRSGTSGSHSLATAAMVQQQSRYDQIAQYYEDHQWPGRSRSNSQMSVDSSAVKARFSNIRSRFRSATTSATPDTTRSNRTTVFSIGNDIGHDSSIYTSQRDPSRQSNRDRDCDDNELLDAQNMSDLQCSDDEEDDFDDACSMDFSRENRTSAENKWIPTPDKVISERKHYRNCLRCIKPLRIDELWTNKPMVKPSTLSPLNLSFLKNVKYASPTSNHSSSLSLASLSSSFSGVLVAPSTPPKKRSFSFKDNFLYYSDTGLSKVPNHFVKEFTVGTSGLIAKEL